MTQRQQWVLAAVLAVVAFAICVGVIEALAWYGGRPTVNNPIQSSAR